MFLPHPPYCIMGRMPKISTRVNTFSESVIRRMTLVNDEHGGINLSQGFPDFDPPAELLEAATRTAAEGPHQYAITWGALNFREALAAKQTRFMNLPLDPEARGRFMKRVCLAARASRKFRAPQVMAY